MMRPLHATTTSGACSTSGRPHCSGRLHCSRLAVVPRAHAQVRGTRREGCACACGTVLQRRVAGDAMPTYI